MMKTDMTTQTSRSLDQINAYSESLIRESYLAGYCSSVWIVNRDDDEEMN